MMPTRQETARDALRAAWAELLIDSLEGALAAAQEDAAAEAVVRSLWPTLPPDALVRLDRSDRDFLVCSQAIPDSFETTLVEALASHAQKRFQATQPDSPYGRGAALRQLVRREVQAHWADIHDRVDGLFETRQSDRLGSPSAIRDKVLQRLSDLMLDDLLQLGTNDETDARRKLKILTALTTLEGNQEQRAACLRRITDGRTASFPYVLKFLNLGDRPSVQSFPPDLEITLSGFRPSLETKFPEVVHVRRCLERYQHREGVVTRFINPDGPISPGLEEMYASTPAYHSRPESGLLVPKSVAISEYRRDTLRVPDGVVCAVSLAVLLESLLRQVASSLRLGSVIKKRGNELLSKVAPAVPLKARTVELFKVVFDQRSLSLREAMAHGVFFASDLERLETTLAGLSQALKCLVEDLETSGNDAAMFTAPRWDAGQVLDAAVPATIMELYQELNLAQRLLPGKWAQAWAVIGELTPDKLYMAQAGSLLWVSGQMDARLGQSDDTHHFAAIHAGLIILEELFRAVYEVHGRRVLRVQGDGKERVRCELAVMDSDAGQLLDPSELKVVFGSWHEYEGERFQGMLKAVQVVRDHVLHGAWQALQDPLHLYSHLIMTMIYALCDVVRIVPEGQSAEQGRA